VVEARARSVVLHRSRRDELRRKILVGAIVLAKVEAEEIDAKLLKQWLEGAVNRADDRELFELDTQ